jgi:hypothetical protein
MEKDKPRKERHTYPSDITREQFNIIRPDLEGARKRTKPRKVDLYDVFCAILYILKSGCQWGMIPADFPKKGCVRYYYDVWGEEREGGGTLLEEILKKIGRATPAQGRPRGGDQLRDRGRPERPERRHRKGEGL